MAFTLSQVNTRPSILPPQVRREMSSLHMSLPTPFDTLTSGLASIARLPKGTTVERSSA
eukprot:CAMPEP_0195533704 /NCGR_PEP_ID=MMETSP0794_2-20130614/41027_1 /TAXON_ID=515487 /ORGANISM="Stephanopyxis turris, Strain CCMP 815" /LENGTH=58 /DNA_ID=CAMNT_0040666335 /DNA_START=58 /DNA_END=230 /DNA_ORIENTATION=-